MLNAGIDPAHVYAARQVGKMITDVNRDACSPEELTAWESAVAGYRQRRADAEQVDVMDHTEASADASLQGSCDDSLDETARE